MAFDFESVTKPTPIASVTADIIKVLGSGYTESAILVGPTNVTHMKNDHPEDFEQYKDEISSIIVSPDYVGINPNDGSIQFIKQLDQHVLVAVRVSGNGTYFLRSVYHITEEKFNSYLKAGRLFEM